jgi:hypothetical protein
MGNAPKRNGSIPMSVPAAIVLLSGAGAALAAPAFAAYQQLTLPVQARHSLLWWLVAAAAPFVAAGVVWQVDPARARRDHRSHLQGTAAVLGAAVAATLALLVAFGAELDARGPYWTFAAAAVVAALVTAIARPILRRRHAGTGPPPVRRRGSRGGRSGSANRRGPGGQQPSNGGSAANPQRKQIWWAHVPFQEGGGSVRRPCLVLGAVDGSVDVLPITENDYTYRSDYLAFRPDSPDTELQPGSLHLWRCTVARAKFERPARTECPTDLWLQVRKQFPPPKPTTTPARAPQAGPGGRNVVR